MVGCRVIIAWYCMLVARKLLWMHSWSRLSRLSGEALEIRSCFAEPDYGLVRGAAQTGGGWEHSVLRGAWNKGVHLNPFIWSYLDIFFHTCTDLYSTCMILVVFMSFHEFIVCHTKHNGRNAMPRYGLRILMKKMKRRPYKGYIRRI